MSLIASMRHNIAGMNTMRSRNQNKGKLASTLEKLASGYMINRSADDAAGLSISEKMRVELTGLGRAIENSKEGIRLIQVGEGALAEVHDMLDRLTYLAEQSANGTYCDEVDREALQKELDQLRTEIGRIAENTNYNGIELFQDIGYEVEHFVSSANSIQQARSTQSVLTRQAAVFEAAEQNRLAAQSSVQSSASGMTLEQVQRDMEPGDFNIFYIESDFETTQTGTNTDSGGKIYTTGVGDPALDLPVAGSGQSLSEVLKKQIVPQTVQNMLNSYPAFSYLNDSSIGIGLRLYNDPRSSVMASVTSGTGLGASSGMQSYMLSVNIAHIQEGGSISEENRVRLESTVAHEMVHAFMYEAATSGMFGYNSAASSFEDANHIFPSWFVEGMAQTASGPDNWLKKPTSVTEGGVTTITRYGGLEIDKDSTEAEIKKAIEDYSLDPSRGASPASQYGTGYLACMYLGASITARIDGLSPEDCANASSISTGLNYLLGEVINGSSLNDAFAKFTDFSNVNDFQTKFNNGTANNMIPFIQKLLGNTGNGLGGIITKDLTAADLTPDAPLENVKLFELNTNNAIVNNVYPNDHEVLTGGTTSTSGTKPTEFNPLGGPSKEFGDFEVYGSDLSGIRYDASSKTLTVDGPGNIRITMKSGVPNTTEKIILAGGGTVSLDGVWTTSGIKVSEDAKVNILGVNKVDSISMDSGKKVSFDGDGQLNVDTFTSDSTNVIHFYGGATIAGNGAGGISGTVKVDGASVAAGLTGVTNSAGTALTACDLDWSKLNKLSGGLTAVSVNGDQTEMRLNPGEPGRLWLDKKEGAGGTFQAQKIVFSGTDSAGNKVSQTYSVQWDPSEGKFKFGTYNVFDVTGGIEGTDWEYDGENNVLKILTDKELTITGGTKTAGSETDYGTIKIDDGVNANLHLNGVQIDATKIGGNTAGIQLGNGGNVNLKMSGDNTITGSGNAAGIQLFGLPKDGGTVNRDDLNASALNIQMEDGSKLSVTGGTNGSKGGAGIGTAWATDSSKGSISITGSGEIEARGGNGGAGIGGSEGGHMGNITIDGTDNGTGGLKITTVGGNHGAGIGSGGWVSNYDSPETQDVGNITITGAVNIDASSTSHGTGIGSACHSSVADITIGQDPDGKPAGVNDKIKITATGGDDGAGIGSGWQGKMGTLTIWGGEIDASSGNRSAGIGSGYEAKGGNGAIIINGGKITATGGTSSSGIGSGMNGSIDSITINGGMITADGGWTEDGGNIGGFDASGNEIKVSIRDPSGLSIKAGQEGEGLYNTTGAFDKDGDQIFALRIGYINQLLTDNTKVPPVESSPAGSTALSFPLKITASLMNDDGTQATDSAGKPITYQWDNIQHFNENNAYIWMKGKNVKLKVEYEDGGTPYSVDVDLKFFPAYGRWRYDEKDLPAELPKKPSVSNQPNTPPSQPGQDPTPTPAPGTEIGPDEPQPKGVDGIILQIGTNKGETLTVPRFYFSQRALQLDTLDISTQDNALNSMEVIRNAINRVSEIRGSYGALHNRLEHNINSLLITKENLTDAESTLRDADIAEQMVDYTKYSILNEASTAMLAQCNQISSDVLRFLE